MMRPRRRLLAAMILVAGVSAAGYTRHWIRSRGPTADSIARIGRVLPSLPVVDISGKVVDLGKENNGRRTIIAFYSPSCHVCQIELPELRPFPDGLRLVMVSEAQDSSGENPETMGLQNVVVFQDRLGTLQRAFPMAALPTILFVDEKGVLRAGLVGNHGRDLLQRKLKEFAAVGG